MRTAAEDTTRALEELDAVPWQALEHAYGSADDVPTLIRARASQKLEDVRDAEHEFYGNIWHQDTIYSATPPAARFLARLLLIDSTLERPSLALLLGCLVRGNQRPDESPPLRYETIAEVTTSLVSIWSLLDRGSEFQRTIPYLLAGLPDAHERIRSDFPNRIDQCSDQETRAGLTMALLAATRGTDHGIAVFSRLLHDGYPLVRFIAAIGLCLSSVPSDPSRIAPTVLHQLKSPPPAEHESKYWAWTPCELLVSDVLETGDASFARRLVIEMLPSLDELDKYTASFIAHDALPLFFDAETTSRLPRLGAVEAALLRQFARDTQVIYTDDLVHEIFDRMNVPDVSALRLRL